MGINTIILWCMGDWLIAMATFDMPNELYVHAPSINCSISVKWLVQVFNSVDNFVD